MSAPPPKKTVLKIYQSHPCFHKFRPIWNLSSAKEYFKITSRERLKDNKRQWKNRAIFNTFGRYLMMKNQGDKCQERSSESYSEEKTRRPQCMINKMIQRLVFNIYVLQISFFHSQSQPIEIIFSSPMKRADLMKNPCLRYGVKSSRGVKTDL